MADLTPTEAAILKAAREYVHARAESREHGPRLNAVKHTHDRLILVVEVDDKMHRASSPDEPHQDDLLGGAA